MSTSTTDTPDYVVVLHFDHGLARLDHAEVDDRADLHRDVVARDDVLRRHVVHDRAKADADDPIDRTEDEDDARSFRLRQELPEAEDHAALVLREDLNRRQQVEHDHDAENQRRRNHHDESP